MDTGEVLSYLSQMVTYWENRANEPYHDFKNHDLHLRYMNACAEAVVLIEESLRMEDDLK